jgi:hypothetical protein
MSDDLQLKYDVALSFLATDEAFAQQLDELLKDRLRTFLYSKRQEDLAGRDGEEVLNRVFGSEARVVVVLYRAGWGETPFTRIEATAIRNRAFNEGYDFTLFVPLDSPAVAPPWLPKNRIWYGLERWGLQGASPVIERLVEEAGGRARQETTEDKIDRTARALAAASTRRDLLSSERGVRLVELELEKFFAEIERITTPRPGTIKFILDREPLGRCIYANGFSLTLVWSSRSRNSLENARLHVLEWDGRADFAGQNYCESQQRVRHKFQADFSDSGAAVWRAEGGKRQFTSAQLADTCFGYLLDLIRRAN